MLRDETEMFYLIYLLQKQTIGLKRMESAMTVVVNFHSNDWWVIFYEGLPEERSQTRKFLTQFRA